MGLSIEVARVLNKRCSQSYKASALLTTYMDTSLLTVVEHSKLMTRIEQETLVFRLFDPFPFRRGRLLIRTKDTQGG